MGTTRLPVVGFMVSGGGNQGLGHVIRSLSIARHLKAQYGTVSIFLSNRDNAVSELINQSEFPLIKSNQNSHDIKTWVLDVPDDGFSLIQKLRQDWPSSQIIALDYFDYKSNCPDIIINLYNHSTDSHLPSGSVTYTEGFRFAIIRNEFKNYRRSLPSGESLSNVFICFGSSDVGNNTFAALKASSLAKLPDVTYHVVIGPNVPHSETLVNAIRHSPLDAVIYHNPTNLPELMANCDLAICGGGTTMLELAYLGVPSIAIGQTKREESFSKTIEDHGAIITAGKTGDCNHQELADLLVELASDISRLKRLSENSMRLIDGNGLDRISHIIAKTLVETS